jgi:hypothetical protein
MDIEDGGDYLNPDTAPYVALTTTGTAALLIIAVLGTIISSPTVHRNAVAMNVYVCCEFMSHEEDSTQY